MNIDINCLKKNQSIEIEKLGSNEEYTVIAVNRFRNQKQEENSCQYSVEIMKHYLEERNDPKSFALKGV